MTKGHGLDGGAGFREELSWWASLPVQGWMGDPPVPLIIPRPSGKKKSMGLTASRSMALPQLSEQWMN